MRQGDFLLIDDGSIIKAGSRHTFTGSLCLGSKRSVCLLTVLGRRCSLLAAKLALDTTNTPWLLGFRLGLQVLWLI